MPSSGRKRGLDPLLATITSIFLFFHPQIFVSKRCGVLYFNTKSSVRKVQKVRKVLLSAASLVVRPSQLSRHGLMDY
jgi:hypothetical protein